MIRVAVNLSWLRPGVVGGSEEYTVRLLEAVVDRAASDLDVRILGSRELRDAHPGLAGLPYTVVPGPVTNRGYRVVAESSLVYRATRHADVVHHFGGRVPARRHGRDIVTIHDLQPLDLPGNFSAVKRRYLGRALPRSAKAARFVCVPSQWVANRVVDVLGVDPERTRVVSSTYGRDGAIDTALAATFGPGPMIVYPAITHPHKNHRVLIEAAEQLCGSYPDLVVVLTGGAGRADDEVEKLVRRGRARIVRTGRIAEPALRGLVTRAAVLAFPSRYEGFGLPVLEAMRCGTPVVVSGTTALPEVTGGAALLADPDDPDGWAHQIDLLLSDAERRDRLRTAGRLRAEHYAPDRCADRLLAVWREAG